MRDRAYTIHIDRTFHFILFFTLKIDLGSKKKKLREVKIILVSLWCTPIDLGVEKKWFRNYNIGVRS